MNSFFRTPVLDWADALPSFSTVLPQDDIAANVPGRTARIIELATSAPRLSNLSGEPENPLYESPPTVSTQTPWVTETSLQTRGAGLGTRWALLPQIAPSPGAAR